MVAGMDWEGARLALTPGVQAALRQLGSDGSFPQDLQQEARAIAELDEVAWQRLRPVYLAARGRAVGGFRLQDACAGGGLVLPTPAPRQRSAALEARCAELRKRLEQQQYDALVHDITQPERDAAASEGGLVTFRQQLGFGVHVLVMMGTFYALGHYAASHVSRNIAHHAAGGLAGLVFAMLMEAVLLIIRSSVPCELPRQRSQGLPRKGGSPWQPGGALQQAAGGTAPPAAAARKAGAPGRRRAERREEIEEKKEQ